MRKHLHIDLGRRSARATDMQGADIVRAGRYFSASVVAAR